MGQVFDVVYVDASHMAGDVLSDAVLAWKLLAPGGIMIFDDYAWSSLRYPGAPDLQVCIAFVSPLHAM